jgi:Rieske Fe-S protein
MLFQILAVVIGGVISLFPVGTGFVAFLDPLWRKKKVPEKYRRPGGGGGDRFVRITSLESLSVGGQPQRFPVIDDKIDEWNFTPAQPVGAVFVQRTADDKVLVFNATCPHAGCSVACDGAAFNCPCHNSSFNLDGTKRVSESGRENPSPRAMDSLKVDEERLKNGELWIEFMNFYTGREEKIAKS